MQGAHSFRVIMRFTVSIIPAHAGSKSLTSNTHDQAPIIPTVVGSAYLLVSYKR